MYHPLCILQSLAVPAVQSQPPPPPTTTTRLGTVLERAAAALSPPPPIQPRRVWQSSNSRSPSRYHETYCSIISIKQRDTLPKPRVFPLCACSVLPKTLLLGTHAIFPLPQMGTLGGLHGGSLDSSPVSCPDSRQPITAGQERSTTFSGAPSSPPLPLWVCHTHGSLIR